MSPRGEGRWMVGARVGADPGELPELPDPSTADWGWPAQQSYAVATARAVREAQAQIDRVEGGTLLVAAAVGLVGGLAAAVGYQLWRRGA